MQISMETEISYVNIALTYAYLSTNCPAVFSMNMCIFTIVDGCFIQIKCIGLLRKNKWKIPNSNISTSLYGLVENVNLIPSANVSTSM